MAKFKLIALAAVVTTYEQEYLIEADSPEEAEAIFRNPEAPTPCGREHSIQLVRESKMTVGPEREDVPVTVHPVREPRPGLRSTRESGLTASIAEPA